MSEDISDLPVPDTDISDLPVPQAQQSPTWAGVGRGLGEVGLSVGSSALRGISSAANDILPEFGWLGGPGAREAEAQKIAQDPILNYRPSSPEGQEYLSALGHVTAPIGEIASGLHQAAAAFLPGGERTADVLGDVATLAPGVRGAFSKLEDANAIEQGHALTGAAEEERAGLSAMKDNAEARGYDLPTSGTQARHADAALNNTPLVNADARAELNLPKGADLTPGMLAKARAKFGAPGYQAIQDLPDQIPLNQKALAAASTDNMNAVPNARLPFPQGDTISGAEAVDFSKKARFLANRLERDPSNPFAAQDAQMYRDAAEAVENSVSDHLNATGQGQLAKNWDDARIYYAKTYSVENALDGAGNVRASDLKSQLFKRGKPLSGKLEEVANLAAQYPEAFKTTRVTQPAVGLVRKAAGAAAPLAGATIGGFLGGAPGAAAGEFIGEGARSRLTSPK